MRDGGGAFQKNQNLLLVRKLKDLQVWEANLRWEDGLIPLEGKHTDVQGSLFLEVHKKLHKKRDKAVTLIYTVILQFLL